MDNRFEVTRKAGIFGILGNIFLLIIKGLIGYITKSQAMIADAANSAGDIFASGMTFIGNKIASTPKDSDHNFGHGKAEYIFSLMISLSMIGIAAKLIIDSIQSVINKDQFEFSWMLVLVACVTIITKLSLYIYTRNAARKYKNILLEANMKDHRNDVVVSTITLISVLLGKIGIFWFDGVVGIGISVWIGITGVKILIESYNVLMDEAIDIETQEKIIKMVESKRNIKSLDSIYSTPVGCQYFVVLTISIDGNMSTFKSHAIADNLENKIGQLPNVYSVIVHVNPV